MGLSGSETKATTKKKQQKGAQYTPVHKKPIHYDLNYKLFNLFPGCCLVWIITPYDAYRESVSENIKKVAYEVFMKK